ncbi:MAG: hypothetical protein AAGA68_23270, partial [Pseudomonadota bacterium]
MRLQLNPSFDPTFPYECLEDIPVDLARAALARKELRGWGLAPRTPLHRLPNLAIEVGVGELFIKDEGLREPLKSFKSLGGAYALGETLRDRTEREWGVRPDYASLFDRKHSDPDYCAVAVTDG